MRNALGKGLFILFLAYAPQAWAETVAVKMETTLGTIELELYLDKAPVTVRNFLRYVNAGKYDNTSFYRVVRMDNQAQNNIKIEVIQGGRGMEDIGGNFPPIVHETTQKTGLKHKDGTISMARLAPGSASSEFFICIGDQPELDFGGQRNPDGFGFAAFGQVTKGMDIVRQIQSADTDMPPPGSKLKYTSGQSLVEPVRIKSIRRFD